MSLYDRDYMRNKQDTSPMTGRKMLFILIIINAAAFIFLSGKTQADIALTITGPGFYSEYLYQIFTAAFLHSNFSHLLFNMWGLYLFGALVAQHANGRKILMIYLAGAVIGNVLFILFNQDAQIPIRLVGASGAVCAMMAAAATCEPDKRFVMIFMPFTPIKTSTMVLCYTAIEILFELFGRNNGIAHLAHLGGFLGGYIAMRIFFGKRLAWDPFRSLFRNAPTVSASFEKDNTASKNYEKKYPEDSRVSQKELDDLLDKLSNHGINSLSEYELKRLKQARKQMRGEE